MSSASDVQQVVFIDSNVPDLQDLLDGLQPGEEAFVLDPSSDGPQQLADILAANDPTNLASISIVSHGASGEIALGSSLITDADLVSNSDALAAIGAALAPGGTIQLYCCDVAQGPAGQQFINGFSTLTGGARYLAGLGLSLERTAVGDRYVIERMREKGYNVGGEQSGLIIFSDYSTTGDGFVSALQVLAMVQKLGKPVSEICRRFEPLPQVLRSVRFSGCLPLENPAVVKTIADVTARRLGDRGRLIVRPSGTEPVIRVMGEADNKALAR
jgi:hypothetical protein